MGDDFLSTIFTSEAIDRLKRAEPPKNELRHRLEILTVGATPQVGQRAARFRYLRAQKSMWNQYTLTAKKCGLFDGPHGRDMKARLASDQDDQFRGAMAECMTCWVLSKKLDLDLRPRPAGRSGRVLELLARLPDGEIHVEVKAPGQQQRDDATGGGRIRVLRRCLVQANKQLAEGVRNVLVIVPKLRTPVERLDLVNALLVEPMATWPLGSSRAGSLREELAPKGSFLRPLKADRTPGFTRIGAVVCLEERVQYKYPPPDLSILLDAKGSLAEWRRCEEVIELFRSDENEAQIGHSVFVVHNPLGANRIPQHIWEGLPQMALRKGALAWTDGHPLEA